MNENPGKVPYKKNSEALLQNTRGTPIIKIHTNKSILKKRAEDI